MSGSSRPAAGPGGAVLPGTRTQEPAGWTRRQQQLSQPPGFSTQSRNDTRHTRACGVQVPSVPVEKSASDVSACAPVTKGVDPRS